MAIAFGMSRTDPRPRSRRRHTRLEIIPLVSYTCNHKTGGTRHPHRLKELKEMITRECDSYRNGRFYAAFLIDTGDNE